MPIEYWNPVPIYYSDVNRNQFLDIQNEINQNILPQMFSIIEWKDNVQTTLSYSTNIVKDLKLEEIEKLINYHTEQFLYGINLHKDYVLFSSWFNKLPKFGYQSLHVHTPKNDPWTSKIFSGVYYYEETSVDMEPLIFHVKNDVSKDTISYNYIPGRIFLFSGLLPHEVKFNKNDEVRKSFSFNISI
ncbi:hypothetical protein EBU95_15815 [bacterium]|nr:hypothetical protein [bacterium]